jgi:hypothetical protein
VTSNFRELTNLVDSIEQGVSCGELTNTELFLFTDNTTAEGAYYKGNSPSRPLFEQILRLRRLEMVATLRLHVIHVAGTQMIQQGTDGLSRGFRFGYAAVPRAVTPCRSYTPPASPLLAPVLVSRLCNHSSHS